MGLFSKLFGRGHTSRPITSDFDRLYFLGRKLGAGAFATVHECVRKADSAKFAVKVISKAKLNGQFDAVINEIDILKLIVHPHVVSLVGMYQTDHTYYLVMTLATGGELFDRILAKGSYTETDAAALTKQLLAALIYLHDEVDIVHRDLKPENLLFRDPKDDANLMVTDFGLSRSVTGSDFLKTTCGSPHYVAPEVIKGLGHGKPVDMWAVGVIVFVLLCGYTPFWGGETNNNSLLFEAVCSATYTFDPLYWHLISLDAKDFIEKLLVVDPGARMTASQALAHPWINTTASVDLLPSVRKNFDAKKTFRKAALAIAMTQHLKNSSAQSLQSLGNLKISEDAIPEAAAEN